MDCRAGAVRLAIVIAMVAMLASPAAAVQSYTVPAGEDFTTQSGFVLKLASEQTTNTNHDWFPDQQTVAIPEEGAVSTSGSGGRVVAGDLSAAQRSLTEIDTNGNTITATPTIGAQVTVSGALDSIQWRDPTLDDGQTDLTVTTPAGSSTVTIAGLPGTTTIEAVDSGTTLATGQSTANGQVTISLPGGTHNVALQTSDDSPDQRPTLSDPTPTGQQSTAPSSVGIRVDDPQFAGGSESVTVDIDLDGSDLSQQTVSSATDVTASVGSLSSGIHNVTVVATDSDGNTASETFSFGVPGTLELRNVSDPPELVTTSVEIRVFRLNSELILTRSPTNGTLDLAGLPADEPLILEFTNASGYRDRTLLVRKLSNNQTAFLLPTSAQNVSVRFALDDNTGRFDQSQSRLLVKRPITLNGTTQYRTVIGERFGASGVTQPLAEGERFRLVVVNQAGDVYVPGNYRSEVSETVTIVVRPSGVNRDPDEPLAFGASQQTVDGAGDQIVFELSDPRGLAQNLEVVIRERGNQTAVANFSQPGPFGNATLTHTLNESIEDAGFVVEFRVARDGEVIRDQLFVGTGVLVFPRLSLFWRQAFASGTLLLTGAAFSQANASIGAVVVGVLGGLFWFVGWLSGGAAGAIALVLALAALWKLRGGP